MQKNGIAGAIWSAVRRLASAPGGIRAAMPVILLLASGLLSTPDSAQATIITATVTGTVASGTDADDLFGQGTTLTGDNYTIVYTIDDTKGTGTVPDYFSTPTQLGSHIYSTSTSNPITAVATINNGPSISFDIPGATVSNQVSRSILSGVSSLTFNLQESYGNAAANGADRLTIGASSLVSAPFTTDPNWEAPLSANAPFNSLGTEGVLQYSTFSNGVATQQVSASLNISNITIGTGSTGPNTAACIQDLTGPTVLSVITSGPVIGAALTPNGGVQKAKTDCGVTNFDWEQALTYVAPYPYTSQGLVPPSGTSDPPPGGWDYQTQAGCPNTYPYYYSISIPAGQPCNLSVNDHIIGDQSLNFLDTPDDPCLPLAANATANEIMEHTVNLATYCGGMNSSASAESFTTTLVGVGASLPTTLYFSWGTTWDGTTGGTFQQNTDGMPDIGSGTGAAFITSIDGVPVSEPPSLAILLFALILLVCARWRLITGSLHNAPKID